MTPLGRPALVAALAAAGAVLLAACGPAAATSDATASAEASGAHGEASADASAGAHGDSSADSHGADPSSEASGGADAGHADEAHADASADPHDTATADASAGDGHGSSGAASTDDVEARLARLEAAVFGDAAAHEAPHWDYAGAATWGDLAPEYATCSSGTQQSPIDLTTPVISGGLQLSPAYHSTTATVTDTGHTVQVDLTDAGGASIAGGTYQLVQFHFHAPSEHTVNGEHSPVELHMVHKDAEGNLAVVGVMIVEGEANPVLEGVLSQIPAAGEKAPLTAALDPAALLPPQLMTYRYIGSLTTPPCTEGVTWSVLAMPISMSAEQIATLTSHFKEPNNRPVQPSEGRELTFGLPVGG